MKVRTKPMCPSSGSESAVELALDVLGDLERGRGRRGRSVEHVDLPGDRLDQEVVDEPAVTSKCLGTDAGGRGSEVVATDLGDEAGERRCEERA